MAESEDLLDKPSEHERELEASPLMSGLRELMQHADTLRAQEEAAEVCRAGFRDAMTGVSEAVLMHEDRALLEQAIQRLNAAALACIEARSRLRIQSESVRGLTTNLNAQLGGLLGKG